MTIATLLAGSALRSLLLAMLAALVLLAVRVHSCARRSQIWSVVLYAALAMPLLTLWVPGLPLSLRVLPPHSAATSMVIAATAVEPAGALQAAAIANPASFSTQPSSQEFSPALPALPRTSNSAAGRTSSSSTDRPDSWTAAVWKKVEPNPDWNYRHAIEAVYLTVAVALLFRLLLGIGLALQLLRRATTITDASALRRLAASSTLVGLRSSPRLLESAAVLVPAAVGHWRPALVLPADWREWPAEKLRLVFAHELAHIARRDALSQRLSLLHRSFFWFSPLAWWLHRHLLVLAEEASDEAALLTGADQAGYAEVILGFFNVLGRARRRVLWHGVAMARGQKAERRVEYVLAWKGGTAMKSVRSSLLKSLLVALPLVVVVAAVRPVLASRLAAPRVLQAVPASQAVPAVPAAPPALPAGAASQAPVASPIPPLAPLAPVSPQPSPTVAPAPMALLPASAALAPLAPAPLALSAMPAPAVAPLPPAAPVAVPPMASPAPAPPQMSMLLPPPPAQAPDFSQQTYTVIVGDDASHLSSTTTNDSGDSGTCSTSTFDAMVLAIGNHCDLRISNAHVVFSASISTREIEFTENGETSRITDPAQVSRARQLFAPLVSLYQQQSALGRRQGELGRQQGNLGNQQGELGQAQAAVAADKLHAAEVNARLAGVLADSRAAAAQDNTAAAQAQLDVVQKEVADVRSQTGKSDYSRIEAELVELQAELRQIQAQLMATPAANLSQIQAPALAAAQSANLGRQQANLGRQQANLGRQQAELGQRQAALGKQQADLGRQQTDLARQSSDLLHTVVTQLRQMLDNAKAHGQTSH